jgi:hypothetical protein
MLKKIFITALLLLIGVTANAGNNRVTPYGDYCRECATYGTCKSILPLKEAVAAIVQYYRDKGCTVGRVRHKGRFIEAEIYHGNRLVDKVLFDRKTSRIRSIL